jgi:hypothetical protein
MKFKPFFIAAIALAMTVSLVQKANSQVVISLIFGDKLNSDKIRFGLDGGVDFSNITNIDPSKFTPGFNLGFYFDIRLKENKPWYVHTGLLLKSPLGADGIKPYSLDNADLDTLFANGTVDRKLRYFNVPLEIRYLYKKSWFIEGGFNLGVLNTAKDVFYADVNDKQDLSFTNNVYKQYKVFDAGIICGIGYHLMKGTGVNFGIRYYAGLMDILKDNPGDPQRNSALYLFASIPIGAGEKAQAKNAAKAREKAEKKAAKAAEQKK